MVSRKRPVDLVSLRQRYRRRQSTSQFLADCPHQQHPGETKEDPKYGPSCLRCHKRPRTNTLNKAVVHSSEDTRLGGSLWRQLAGRDPHCATAEALQRVQESAKHTPPSLAAPTRRLVVLLNRKSELLARARKDIQYKAYMDIWLYAHVPLSFTLLAALITHIVSEFTYW